MKVSGKVVDRNDEPVIGATIKEEDGSVGTVTDIEEILLYPYRQIKQ